ncbi:MAG: glycosyltransferase family 4 protein [Proteobacteria bacterium]|nr:glycosyltransferase family 4 protein [Pseudomonadota bacterium]MBU1058824.1 glycosyltransferase family 4 protein [Pseudomonadota bacterium]
MKEILRGNIIWCGEHLDPFVGSSLKKCLTIICRTHFVAERLLDRTGLSTDAVIPDTGLDQEDIDRLYRLSCRPGKGKRVQLIFLGRLIARKGVGLAIKSFARVASQFHNAELIVIGDGPERRALEELSDKLGLNSRVRFTGRIDRNQAWELLAEGDVFLYPSLRDAVATVVLEAMAAGLPVVCLEGTGPAQVVTPDIGLVARGNDEKEITDDLAVAISRLLEDKDLRQKMGRCAQETVAAQHSWEARAQAMMKVYASMERRLKEHG